MRRARERAALAVHRARALLDTWTGTASRRLDRRRGQVAILMYHRVIADAASVSGIEPGMYVRASTFDRQLEWLARRWRIRTLHEALDSPPAATEPPIVVLTFDDAWRDNLTVAWPILERHRARAVLFTVREFSAAGRVNGSEFIRPDELAELAGKGMEIGAHTVTHRRSTDLDVETVRDEMLASREAVEEWTGRACDTFAYPFGAHDTRAVEVARSIFRASVIVGGGWWARGADRARLPRIGIHQDMTATPALFALRLARAHA